jgi:2-dehydro-3-deoxygluconokinase
VDVWSGKYILQKGRAYGVNMDDVILEKFDGIGKTRNGFSFVEVGIGPRASRNIYDRGHTAISKCGRGSFDWDRILKQTRWFHTTGITAALSDHTADMIIEVLQTAKKLGVTTSFDLNYRSSLWSEEKAQEVMRSILPYVDVLFGNEEDFGKMLGIRADGVDRNYSNVDPVCYEAVARKVKRRYPDVQIVGTTLREVKSALLNNWSVVILYKDRYYISKKYHDVEIYDRTGGGDSFVSAIVCGMLEGREMQNLVDFAAAYSALCHTYLGDQNLASKEETEDLMRGESARVKR